MFGSIKELDDLERSFKDMERSRRQDTVQDLKLPKEQIMPQQNIIPLKPELEMDDPQEADRAVIKNQERLKKMLDAQKGINQEAASWGPVISRKRMLIIELFSVGLFISVFSFLYYKKRIKKVEIEVKEQKEEEDGPDDGITFYKT
jgi:hypothetical protein